MTTVDTVVLDIDGVLVDDAGSYRRAIRETLWVHYGETITPDDVQAFKAAGGFNNDWELTDAAALWLLARRSGYAGSITAYTEAIEEAGGGLAGAQEVLETALTAAAWTSITARWSPTSLRQVFQHLYLGTDGYAAIEGPPIWTGLPGYITTEPVLISATTVEKLQNAVAVGVVTGRPAAEATIALERAGVSVPREHRVTMDDPFPAKPDPSGLLAVCDRLDTEHAVFVGDTRDDMEAARRANAASDRRIDTIGVMTGSTADKTVFEDAGARSVLDSVDDLSTAIGIGDPD